jgi:hypothetical protein
VGYINLDHVRRLDAERKFMGILSGLYVDLIKLIIYIPDIVTWSPGRLTMPRVELNTNAPDFTLEDFTGKKVALSDYIGQKHVMVVFNRGFF